MKEKEYIDFNVRIFKNEEGKLNFALSKKGESEYRPYPYEEFISIKDIINKISKFIYDNGEFYDPSYMHHCYTEEEFINICNEGLQSTLHVGDVIELDNEYCSLYHVIGKNHDGTTDTVDIMPDTQVGVMRFNTKNNSYSASGIRKWINTDYLSAFSSTIQSLARYMAVDVIESDKNHITLYDKAKLLSVTELNATTFDKYSSNEGEPYPIFNPAEYNANDIYARSRWVLDGKYGDVRYYWLRTKNTDNKYFECYVKNTGDINDHDSKYSYGIVPVLRF